MKATCYYCNEALEPDDFIWLQDTVFPGQRLETLKEACIVHQDCFENNEQ